jgi:hypothetical protein
MARRHAPAELNAGKVDYFAERLQTVIARAQSRRLVYACQL